MVGCLPRVDVIVTMVVKMGIVGVMFHCIVERKGGEEEEGGYKDGGGASCKAQRLSCR